MCREDEDEDDYYDFDYFYTSNFVDSNEAFLVSILAYVRRLNLHISEEPGQRFVPVNPWTRP